MLTIFGRGREGTAHLSDPTKEDSLHPLPFAPDEY
jgi:hypothetical protein